MAVNRTQTFNLRYVVTWERELEYKVNWRWCKLKSPVKKRIGYPSSIHRVCGNPLLQFSVYKARHLGTLHQRCIIAYREDGKMGQTFIRLFEIQKMHKGLKLSNTCGFDSCVCVCVFVQKYLWRLCFLSETPSLKGSLRVNFGLR